MLLNVINIGNICMTCKGYFLIFNFKPAFAFKINAGNLSNALLRYGYHNILRF